MSTSQATPATRKKSGSKRKIKEGRIYIQSSYNNTIVSVTDLQGNVLAISSAGRVGFSGARKATPYAAQKVIADLLERLGPFQMKEVKVFVRGIGSAREAAIRTLAMSGLAVTSIRDITPIPHNGVRPPKRRRI